MDLLTTYTHDSKVQAITAPPLISKIHKSSQRPLSLFQHAVSTPAALWQRLLTLEILQLHARKFSLHRLPYRTDLVKIRARVTLRLAIYGQSVLLGDKSLRLTTSKFIFQLNICGYSSYIASSLTIGRVYRLQLLLVLASDVTLRSESRRVHDHILMSQIRGAPNLEGQVPVYISPRNRMARLYPQALGSLFIAFYDSQGYGGNIPPRLHACRPSCLQDKSSAHTTQKHHVSNSTSIVAGRV
jgi:hypothetical protein